MPRKKVLFFAKESNHGLSTAVSAWQQSLYVFPGCSHCHNAHYFTTMLGTCNSNNVFSSSRIYFMRGKAWAGNAPRILSTEGGKHSNGSADLTLIVRQCLFLSFDVELVTQRPLSRWCGMKLLFSFSVHKIK